LVLAGAARADTIVSDRASALLVYPFVIVDEGEGVDTILELSNTSDQPVAVRCYYVNALGRCSATGDACFVSKDCSEGDTCAPQCSETDFTVYLTPFQPIAWVASKGLANSDIPLDGVFRRGVGGSSNAGTRVPPFGIDSGNLGSQSGIGELKCYAIDPDGAPSERNVLKGHFSVVGAGAGIDVSKASAVGFRALPGANDRDNRLVLGGEGAEYDGCPAVLVLDHFFDGATDPVSGQRISTALVLLPCTQNFLTQVPTRTPVQYLVFNEFEQRFSTSAPVDCFFVQPISSIDTPSSSRSIFSVNVAGTMTGQTRIRGVRGGLVGAAFEFHGGVASFNLHLQGARTESDVITVAR